MSTTTMLPSIPFAPMAEKSLLSAVMQGKAWLSRALSEGIGKDTFHLPAHQTLWDELKSANGRHHAATESGVETFDIAAFAQHLAMAGLIDRVGGLAAVADIYGFAVTTAGWQVWIGQLRETEAHRRALRLAFDLSEASDSTEAVEAAEAAIRAMRKTLGGSRRAIPAKVATQAFLDRFRADHAAGDIPGRSSGIFAVDAVSGGMRPGELWVIGGRPSRGKSVLMLQMAAAVLQDGKAVAVFSLEMMASEIVARLISNIGRVDLSSLTQPRTATKGDISSILRAAGTISESRLHIDDSPGQTAETICAEAMRIRDANGGLDLVVVDYLQLIRSAGGRARGESREEEVARASGAMKQLAKELRCPVITGSQLNDDGKTRESRAIEQDSDALLLIVDDGVSIQKMRNGKRGDLLPLVLDGAHQKFSEVSGIRRH